MPATPFLERKASIRGLGAAFIAVMLVFLWLTYAVFTQKFVDYVPVTLTASEAGVALPSNADVKIRGMIVGEVRKIEPTADGVKMKIAMKPDLIKLVPRGVTAEIIPKTLFGEKYISLIPPKVPDGQSLRAGDNIAKADVPIEVETLLNDLYPLLEAVQPAELSSTLTAVSTALTGRGEQLGQTLVTANDYLKKLNPDVPQLVDDLTKLGTVSDSYADALPELGRVLTNLVVTGDTVVAKRAQLQAFFEEGAKLGDTAREFLAANEENIPTIAREGRPVLNVLSDYSIVFPCVLKAITDITPRLASAFRGQTLHINLSILGNQPTGYKPGENGTIPSKTVIDANTFAQPSCHSLDNGDNITQPGEVRDGFKYSFTNKAPVPPYSVYSLLGLDPDNKHNKFNRATVADSDLVGLVQPSVDGVDSPGDRAQLKSLLGASLGMTQKEIPDVGPLLLGPMFRGMEVTASEAR